MNSVRSLFLAQSAWPRGTLMKVIIEDGWSRGLHFQQTLHECIQQGYSACVASPAIMANWKKEDATYKAHQEREKRITHYRDYWERNVRQLHHKADCVNPRCDAQLNIARPQDGSGDMWDSLAQCPFCDVMFFYESRPRSVALWARGWMK